MGTAAPHHGGKRRTCLAYLAITQASCARVLSSQHLFLCEGLLWTRAHAASKLRHTPHSSCPPTGYHPHAGGPHAHSMAANQDIPQQPQLAVPNTDLPAARVSGIVLTMAHEAAGSLATQPQAFAQPDQAISQGHGVLHAATAAQHPYHPPDTQFLAGPAANQQTGGQYTMGAAQQAGGQGAVTQVRAWGAFHTGTRAELILSCSCLQTVCCLNIAATRYEPLTPCPFKQAYPHAQHFASPSGSAVATPTTANAMMRTGLAAAPPTNHTQLDPPAIEHQTAGATSINQAPAGLYDVAAVPSSPLHGHGLPSTVANIAAVQPEMLAQPPALSAVSGAPVYVSSPAMAASVAAPPAPPARSSLSGSVHVPYFPQPQLSAATGLAAAQAAVSGGSLLPASTPELPSMPHASSGTLGLAGSHVTHCTPSASAPLTVTAARLPVDPSFALPSLDALPSARDVVRFLESVAGPVDACRAAAEGHVRQVVSELSAALGVIQEAQAGMYQKRRAVKTALEAVASSKWRKVRCRWRAVAFLVLAPPDGLVRRNCGSNRVAMPYMTPPSMCRLPFHTAVLPSFTVMSIGSQPSAAP